MTHELCGPILPSMKTENETEREIEAVDEPESSLEDWPLPTDYPNIVPFSVILSAKPEEAAAPESETVDDGDDENEPSDEGESEDESAIEGDSELMPELEVDERR